MVCHNLGFQPKVSDVSAKEKVTWRCTITKGDMWKPKGEEGNILGRGKSGSLETTMALPVKWGLSILPPLPPPNRPFKNPMSEAVQSLENVAF